MATKNNLLAAFAGESQASMKYTAFAKKADKEGLPQIARLFRAAAEAENVHASAHLRAMNGVKSTSENLAEAIGGEEQEFKQMYPKFLDEAEREEQKQAEASFKNALAVEKIHHGLYIRALESAKAGKDMTGTKMYVCSVCGNTVEADIPKNCPVCGAPDAKFSEVL